MEKGRASGDPAEEKATGDLQKLLGETLKTRTTAGSSA